MAATKMTFTLDDETARRIERTARRLGVPKSRVVREAVKEYAVRADRLSEEERARLVAILDEMLAQPPTRPQGEVDREIAEIRRARRGGGRLHPSD